MSPQNEHFSDIRSLLFVPGHKERWIENAVDQPADALALDLEDSVPDTMRATAVDAVSRKTRVGLQIPVLVRTGAVEDRTFAEDVHAAVSVNTEAIILPKASHPDHITSADLEISNRERELGIIPGRTPLILLIESAQAIVRLGSLLAASSRIVGTIFAGADGGDLIRDLGAIWSRDGRSLLYARSRVLLESRAAGLTVILDSVYADVEDLDGLREDIQLSRELGYTGRPAIHPVQVLPINDGYERTHGELQRATRIIEGYDQAQRRGSGAALVDGQLVDRATEKAARDTLSRYRGR